MPAALRKAEAAALAASDPPLVDTNEEPTCPDILLAALALVAFCVF